MSEQVITLDMFKPRDYQLEYIREFEAGIKKRFMIIWPRRAGKDLCTFNLLIGAALRKVSTYFYILPTFSQARRIIFESIDPFNGKMFFDYIPKECIKKINHTEMKLTLINDSLIIFIGSDNYDRLVGTNAYGMVFSEFSLQDPAAYAHLRPILSQNDGWAAFVATPRGRNHLYTMYNIATENKEHWYVSKLTLDDTKHIDLEAVNREREDEELSEELIQQEYYTSFSRGASGFAYSKYMDKMALESRITNVQYETSYLVNSVWDIGVGDSTVFILYTIVGNRVLILNSYDNNRFGLEHYVDKLDELKREHGYIYNFHFAPHDCAVKEWGSGLTRIEVAKRLGLEFQITKNIAISDGIESLKVAFNKIFIDEKKNRKLIKALSNYRYVYDEKRKDYSTVPYKDWTNHYCDAMRYLAINLPRSQESYSAQDIEKNYRESLGIPTQEQELRYY